MYMCYCHIKGNLSKNEIQKLNPRAEKGGDEDLVLTAPALGFWFFVGFLEQFPAVLHLG